MAAPDTTQLDALVEPRDREFVARIADAAERDTVVAALVRHRRAEPLCVGDSVPPLELHRGEDGSTVRLHELVSERPLVLVFGSYT
jgi:hypothetical protein